VIPPDRKWYRNYPVARLLIEALDGLDLGWLAAGLDVASERARVAGP
jgi:hypothetical protein